MPRTGGKKPILTSLYNRHLDEMRRLLHTLDPHVSAEDEGGLPVQMDIFETEQEIVIELDLPGTELAAITLLQRGMVLQIEADKCSDAPPEQSRYICMERHFGRFRRSIRLPECVDPCNLKAVYSRGVLRINCPKVRERRIPIKESSSE